MAYKSRTTKNRDLEEVELLSMSDDMVESHNVSPIFQISCLMMSVLFFKFLSYFCFLLQCDDSCLAKISWRSAP